MKGPFHQTDPFFFCCYEFKVTSHHKDRRGEPLPSHPGLLLALRGRAGAPEVKGVFAVVRSRFSQEPRVEFTPAMKVIMKKHQHNFVNEYDDMVAFGFSREVDEKSLMIYLQKFSEDDFLKVLVPRLKDAEINQIFELISDLMHKHLTEDEYHRYFLKDE